MDIELSALMRGSSGKGAARRLRAEDRVPAVLYGPKLAPVSLSVPARRLEKLLRDMGEESRLLNLVIEDEKDGPKRQVLIREVQVHPVRRRFLHVDFYEVPLDQPITVEVPVEMVGEPVGVKKGGTLNLVRRMVSVRCLPGEIPERVQVDVNNLDLGGTVRIEDLVSQVPFELVDDSKTTIINILSPEGKGGEGEGEAASA